MSQSRMEEGGGQPGSGEEGGGLLEGGVAQGQTEKPKDGVTEEGPRPS